MMDHRAEEHIRTLRRLNHQWLTEALFGVRTPSTWAETFEREENERKKNMPTPESTPNHQG